MARGQPGPGSTPLLNEMIEALVLDALERGATPSEAARHGGVDPRTLRRWSQRGREADARARSGAELTDVDERMRAFNARIEQASMQARLRAVDRIQRSLAHEEVCLTPWAVLIVEGEEYHPILDEVGADIQGCTVRAQCSHKVVAADWRAGAWYLERVDPETWGRVNRQGGDRVETPGDVDPDDDSEVVQKVESLLAEIFPDIHVPGVMSTLDDE